MNTSLVPMASLTMGEEAVIRSIADDARPRLRLLGLGLVPGTRVKMLRPGPLGDPLLFRFRGTAIALRQADAAVISVCRSLHDPLPHHAYEPTAATSLTYAGNGALSGTTVPTIALVGNPNTGKSTLFNRLTGMQQHTGNWPGKTVLRAEGVYRGNCGSFRVIDLPGTYTLLAVSAEERVARDFICFGQPDVTVVIADATALERNLSLVLQVMEITSRIVLCINLIDEAHRKGLAIDMVTLQQCLGIPVVGTSARTGEGVGELMAVVSGVARGVIVPQPRQITYDIDIEQAIDQALAKVHPALARYVSSRWLALRLVEEDYTVLEALREYVGDYPHLAQAWRCMDALAGIKA